MISGTDAPRSGTLRDIYGDLAPVAVIRSEDSETPGDVMACPGRDLIVHEGDWMAMIGTADELADEGITVAADSNGSAGRGRSSFAKVANAVRAFRHDVNPKFYRALSVSLSLLLGSTMLLWFTYDKPGMSCVDALYFSTETIATVGYGDFSFIDQPL